MQVRNYGPAFSSIYSIRNVKLKNKYENNYLFSWIDLFKLSKEVCPVVFNPKSTCPDDKLNTSKIPFLQINIYNLFFCVFWGGRGGGYGQYVQYSIIINK